MVLYGQSVTWTDKKGNVTKITVSGRASVEDAKRDALKEAKAFGWEPPRWWQFWRKNDTTMDDLLVA